MNREFRCMIIHDDSDEGTWTHSTKTNRVSSVAWILFAFQTTLRATLCGFVIIQVVISAPAISAADLAKETIDYTATCFFFNRFLLDVLGMVDHAL